MVPDVVITAAIAVEAMPTIESNPKRQIYQSIAKTLTEITALLYTSGEDARKLLDSPAIETYLYEPHMTSSNYDEELIQVAATAITAITDKWTEQGMSLAEVESLVYHRVVKERLRQDYRFGAMPRSPNPFVWIVVLGEELAEVIAEIGNSFG